MNRALVGVAAAISCFLNQGWRGLSATAPPPLGQRRADHQLDLMEEHEGEDGRAHGVRSEDHPGHGDA